MFTRKIYRQCAIGLLALTGLAFTADRLIGPTSHTNFIELPNEGGIHMTASGFSFADATIPGRNLPRFIAHRAWWIHAGCDRFAYRDQPDRLQLPDQYPESPGGPISDQVL